MTSLDLPPGYGFVVLSADDRHQLLTSRDHLDALMDFLLIWEAPQRGHSYVIAADVSDGIGLDRSVVDVCRVGTIERPAEQVAQFVSASVDPVTLAYLIDPIGRLYQDSEGLEAKVAVETNNHGVATQSELQDHTGYGHFFIWEYEDAAPGTKRLSTRIGWVTTARTRPLILTRWHKSLTNVDPNTGQPDYRLNSPHTYDELKDFRPPPGMGLAYAEASPGAHDDCIMASAISVHVSYKEAVGEIEPLSEQRARIAERKAREAAMSDETGVRRDYRNTDTSYDEMLGRDEDRYAEV